MPDENGISFRWGVSLLDEGMTAIPNIFFRRYAACGVSRAEFLFILHLASYRYESEEGECRPALGTIAQEMGCHIRYTKQLIHDLVARNLLIVERRPGLPNVYNLRPLAVKLLGLEDNEAGVVHQSAPVGSSAPGCTGGSAPGCTGVVHQGAPEEEKKKKNKEEGNFSLSSLPSADVQAALLFGAERDPQSRQAAVPDTLIEWNGPLRELSDHLGVDLEVMPEKQQKQWARRLAKIGQSWQITPNELVAALRRLFQAKEFAWKTYSGPFGALEIDLGVILGRMKSRAQVTEGAAIESLSLRKDGLPHLSIPNSSLDSVALWNCVLDESKHAMTKATFEANLAGTYIAAVTDHTVTVHVASESARAWLDARLRPVIERAMAGLVPEAGSV